MSVTWLHRPGPVAGNDLNKPAVGRGAGHSRESTGNHGRASMKVASQGVETVFGRWQSRGTENNVGLMRCYTFSSVLRSHSLQETAKEPLCGPFPLPVSCCWLRQDTRMIFGE